MEFKLNYSALTFDAQHAQLDTPTLTKHTHTHKTHPHSHLCTNSLTPKWIFDTARELSLLHKSKGKDHVPSTSQKAGLTRLYKKFLFMSTTAISKPVLQEVDGTVILPLTDTAKCKKGQKTLKLHVVAMKEIRLNYRNLCHWQHCFFRYNM